MTNYTKRQYDRDARLAAVMTADDAMCFTYRRINELAAAGIYSGKHVDALMRLQYGYEKRADRERDAAAA